jgi:ribose-phosphate pyrophosphokinase
MLLHAIEAGALADAQYVTAVVPYFPGARQDKRKGRTREGISAGLFARCLEDAGARRVISVEIHNEAIGGMFDPPQCRLENLYLHQVLCGWLKERGLQGDIVASPDVGGLERARHYAEELHCGLAALSKERDYSKPNTVLQSTLIGDVRDKDVLLVDDIVDTAGSVVAAVQELKENGARNVTVTCAHPVFSHPAWERLTGLAERAEREGWRFRVVGTSAVEHPAAPSWYESFDIASLLGRVIRSVNMRDSVTGASGNSH